MSTKIHIGGPLRVWKTADGLYFRVHSHLFEFSGAGALLLLLALVDSLEVRLPLDLRNPANEERYYVIQVFVMRRRNGDIILFSPWGSTTVQSSIVLDSYLKLRLAQLIIRAFVSPVD